MTSIDFAWGFVGTVGPWERAFWLIAFAVLVFGLVKLAKLIWMAFSS